MAEIGDGYGSECHLLRFLGRHRAYLNKLILKETGLEIIEWLDFRFRTSKGGWHDAEMKGVEFIQDKSLGKAWKQFWPQTGNVQNWDAVAKVMNRGNEEWLLVEAKSHLGEEKSDCGAVADESKTMIKRVFSEVKKYLGVDDKQDWESKYYQYANRIAFLYFLQRHNNSAHLLFIYFLGDQFPEKICPQNQSEWDETLKAQDDHICLPLNNPFSDRIHKLFLNVKGD